MRGPSARAQDKSSRPWCPRPVGGGGDYNSQRAPRRGRGGRRQREDGRVPGLHLRHRERQIGACRHGDRCSRLHNRPTFSQTIVLLNLYRNPQNTAQSADGSHCHVSDVEVQEHYDNFFEEVFTELEEKYGEIEEMNICDNLGDHLVGNVYVKAVLTLVPHQFRREEDAERAVGELNNRWFNGQAVRAELSPVTDFRESCCRQYEMGECTRGGFCNFMHLRPISRELRRQLYGHSRRQRAPSTSRSHDQPRGRKRQRSPDHRYGRF